MHKPENLERSQASRHAGDILVALNEMPVWERGDESRLGIERFSMTWSPRLLALSGGAFAVLVVLAGIHTIVPLTGLLLRAVIIVAALVQSFALASLVLSVASGITSFVIRYRRIGHECASEISHDHEMAGRLTSYPMEALGAVDSWLDQKMKRMERRQLRFFGGSDKLAIATLLTAGWSTWKEVGSALTLWEPSPLLFGAAFLFGLAMGGMTLAALSERFAYQRDLLQIAKSLKIGLYAKEDEN